MLDPDLVLVAVVDAFKSIDELATLMCDDAGASTIFGHTFTYGEENTLTKVVWTAPSPSLIVAYTDLLSGNFDGQTMWKHCLEVYIRPKSGVSNVFSDSNPDVARVPSTPHIWWMMMNLPVLGGAQPLRYTTLLSGALQLMDLPTLSYKAVGDDGADLFIGKLVFPEYGDQ